jgi:protein MpaA
MITPQNFEDFKVKPTEKEQLISKFCEKLASYFGKYNWREVPCEGIKWNAEYKTPKNNPLITVEFGSGGPTTLFLGGVHGDELTTMPVAFRFVKYLKDNPELYRNSKVVVAPLINPDGFMLDRPTRENANFVDLNRNFFTHDWFSLSKERWRTVKNRDPRVFPGYFPNTEIEIIFQIELLEKYFPEKILSLHAPLGFLDYDGPGANTKKKLTTSEEKAKRLVHDISKKSRNFTVIGYGFYPGSLGNYAGNERQIPTVTLEFDTADPSKFEQDWAQFLPGLIHLVTYQVDPADKNQISSLFLKNYKQNEIK